MKTNLKILITIGIFIILSISYIGYEHFKPAWVFANQIDEVPDKYVEITRDDIDKFPLLVDLFDEVDKYRDENIAEDGMIGLNHEDGEALINRFGEGYMEYGYYHQYVKYNDKHYLIWILFQYETPLRL